MSNVLEDSLFVSQNKKYQKRRSCPFRVEDVEATVAELEQMGIGCEPIRLDSYTQKKMTFFFDPDGLPLELHE